MPKMNVVMFGDRSDSAKLAEIFAAGTVGSADEYKFPAVVESHPHREEYVGEDEYHIYTPASETTQLHFADGTTANDINAVVICTKNKDSKLSGRLAAARRQYPNAAIMLAEVKLGPLEEIKIAARTKTVTQLVTGRNIQASYSHITCSAKTGSPITYNALPEVSAAASLSKLNCCLAEGIEILQERIGHLNALMIDGKEDQTRNSKLRSLVGFQGKLKAAQMLIERGPQPGTAGESQTFAQLAELVHTNLQKLTLSMPDQEALGTQRNVFSRIIQRIRDIFSPKKELAAQHMQHTESGKAVLRVQEAMQAWTKPAKPDPAQPRLEAPLEDPMRQ